MASLTPVGWLPRLRTLRSPEQFPFSACSQFQLPMERRKHRCLNLSVFAISFWCTVPGLTAQAGTRLFPFLQQNGFHVTAVHLPFTTLAEDAAAVKRTLALQDGPVLLWTFFMAEL